MFKKKLTMLIAAALMTLSASSAFAAFGNLELIRVISDNTNGSTTEVATDLGNISNLIGTNQIVGGGVNAFTNFTNSSHDLYVNYYVWASSTTTKGTLDIASNSATTPSAAGSALTKGVMNVIQAYYGGLSPAAGATTTVVANNTTTGSFGQQMGLTGLGGYSGYTQSIASTTSLSLASLTPAKPIEMTLWQFANGSAITAGITGTQIGPVAFKLTTNADGSTTVNNASTPIPAAAWLLGSGLMGLFGIRRKMNA